MAELQLPCRGLAQQTAGAVVQALVDKGIALCAHDKITLWALVGRVDDVHGAAAGHAQLRGCGRGRRRQSTYR